MTMPSHEDTTVLSDKRQLGAGVIVIATVAGVLLLVMSGGEEPERRATPDNDGLNIPADEYTVPSGNATRAEQVRQAVQEQKEEYTAQQKDGHTRRALEEELQDSGEYTVPGN